MDEQTKFRTALAALSASAQQKDLKLTQADVREFFQDMELNEDQYQLVYAYLVSKHIQVEGVELPRISTTEVPYTEEEENFLNQYQKDLKYLRKQPTDKLDMLFEQAADGDTQAKQKLTEHYMNWVLNIAKEYAHQGLLIQDLIQEGNLGLMIGLDTLGLMEEGLTWETHLEKEIHRAIRMALDEQNGEKSTGEQVAEKLNKLADSITELTEELGRQVTPEELSIYLDMDMEEIEDLLRIAGENIEVDDSGNPQDSNRTE
jgi:RNA polymerase primary sigma factor